MIVFPNAKINLGLNITERRPDGYHNLETVFYPLQLQDALEVIESKGMSFTSSGIEIPGSSENNLCLKAYNLLKQDHHLPPVAIHLHKHIPIGAGLGGGSADAAFFIKLVNKQFGLRLSDDTMENYARKLGADCAFFIANEPVYAFGKGDEFEAIDVDLSSYFMVLVKPSVHVSTATAYRNAKVAQPKTSLKELIQLPLNEWKANILNDFEQSVFEAYPEIDEIKTKLYAAGATFALMSGSGSSVYAIFDRPVQLPALEKDNLVFYGV